MDTSVLSMYNRSNEENQDTSSELTIDCATNEVIFLVDPNLLGLLYFSNTLDSHIPMGKESL